MNEDYYKGMSVGVNQCCKLMTHCVTAITEEKEVKAKYYVGKTAESMAKLAKNVEKELNTYEKKERYS